MEGLERAPCTRARKKLSRFCYNQATSIRAGARRSHPEARDPNGLSPPCRMHAHGSPRCMNRAAFRIPPGHAKTACLLPGFTRVLHCIQKRVKTVKTVKDVVKTG